jgi:hypothetical protein
MPDMSKCSNRECPIKEKCYRYTCESSPWQGYTRFQFTDGCPWFVKIKKEEDAIEGKR